MTGNERPHLAALRDGDQLRRASVAPPRRPNVSSPDHRATEPEPVPLDPAGEGQSTEPGEVDEPEVDEPEVASAVDEPPSTARPKGRSRPKKRSKPVSPAAGGRLRGSRREFQVRLTETASARLYEFSERERMTLGQAAMAAVRQEHKALRAETVVTVEDDGFAPVELTRRPLAATEPKRLVTIRVTEAEADAFDKLADDTRMSYSLLLDEAIRRAHSLGYHASSS